jgi:inosine/xanthosine triphosphatase
MKIVIVASKNPVKIHAAETALKTLFPNDEFEMNGFSASSGVSNQPMTDEETLQGALNRIEHAKQEHPNADIWIAMEGGLHDYDRGMESLAWMTVENKEGKKGRARTAAYPIPEGIAKLIRTGLELGDADDQFFGTSNSKQAGGLVGLLTDNAMTRVGYYHHALILASIPLIRTELY